ncbi:MAG: 23S rRNA (uracil(1939)-C(5))-methyltransferase RlmD [Ignavibacterium sp.]|nr:23S rRNA (uracil(1939)-C(5))-methyltransferase RlmD [Ignavibacterium sp.]
MFLNYRINNYEDLIIYIPMNIKKGDLIELSITKYAFEGKGIAKISKDKLLGKENSSTEENYVVFVQNSYPGDKVKARLLKIKNSYAEAVATEILKSSEYRTELKCKFFGICGGCKQQDLDYNKQLEYKQQQVEEVFHNIAGLKEIKSEKIIPSDRIFEYRNKMEFSFSDVRWLTKEELQSDEKIERNFALGFHIPKIYDKVLDIDECFLQTQIANDILNFTREYFKSKNISAYSQKTHKGFLRNLIIRQAFHTNDLMVNLVTYDDEPQLIEGYANALSEKFSQVSTLVNNINKKLSSVSTGDYEKVIFGSGFIYDYIGKYKFRISSNSFFQTNTSQAEKLYQTAVDFAEFNGNEIVYDLYSGAGTITLFISDFVKELYAFESVNSAVEDAEFNAQLNNVTNVKFFTADLYKSFLPIVKENKIPKPDIIIIDPPRSGMHKNTVSDVITLSPKKIVYVSCNPATQARDVKLFLDAGYKFIKMKPVDMFPHTYHIENVVLLTK